MTSQNRQKLEDEVTALRRRIAELETSCRYSSELESIVDERTEELRTLNRELHESQQRYQQLFSEMLDGFALHEIICDESGKPCNYRFLEVNRAFEKLTGLKADDLLDNTVLDVMPGTEAYWIDTYGKVALTGEPVHFEDYAGELDKYYEVTAYCPRKGRFAVIFADITARKRAEIERVELERQIQQTQKLESLGLLAGGIAHDFNNLLMAILGNADLALNELSPVSPARECLQDIEKAARRSAELCRQLLAYSGKGRFEIQPIDLTELVREMAHMLEVTIPKKVTLRYAFVDGLPTVEADATQLRQVVMNLITNASEAIDDDPGMVTVATGTMTCDAEYLARTFEGETLAEGVYTILEVSDTGCGMEKENIPKVFDPFYTTKFTGRGLGMSAVLGIVRGHKGAIKMYSEPGKGTTVKVLLPAVDAPAETVSREPPPPAGWRGSGTVLLVDDEETLRSTAKRMLQRLGFDVRTATDGREALQIFAAHAEEIVCVILDLTMPRMDGEEAFREIRRIKEDARVLLSSGYNEQEVVNKFAGKGLAGFVQKPYNTAILAQKLRAIL